MFVHLSFSFINHSQHHYSYLCLINKYVSDALNVTLLL